MNNSQYKLPENLDDQHNFNLNERILDKVLFKMIILLANFKILIIVSKQSL